MYIRFASHTFLPRLWWHLGSWKGPNTSTLSYERVSYGLWTQLDQQYLRRILGERVLGAKKGSVSPAKTLTCPILENKWPFCDHFGAKLFLLRTIYEWLREVEKSDPKDLRQLFFPYFRIFMGPLWMDRSPSSVDRFCSYLERFQALEGENGFRYQKGSFLTWIS